MDSSILILIGLLLVVVIFVLPIAAIVVALKARRETEGFQEQLREQLIAHNELKRRVDDAARVAPSAAPSTRAAAPPPASAPTTAVPPATVAAATTPPSAAFSQLRVDDLERPATDASPSATPPPSAPAPLSSPKPGVAAQPPALPPLPELPKVAALTPPPLPPAAVAAALADAKAEAAAHQARPAATPAFQAPPPVPPPAPAPAAPPPAPKPPRDWEKLMWTRIVPIVATIALLLAVIFIIREAIQNDWIPFEVQIAAVFVGGAGLLAGGVWADRKGYRIPGQALVASGTLVLYAVTFACSALYKTELPLFANPLVPFALMSLTTLVAFLISVRLAAQVVATLGLLGGFLTPVLISTGKDNPLGLFGYLTILDLGLLAVALRCRWHHLVVLAAVGTGVLEIGWAAKFFRADNLEVAVAAVAWFSLLFPAAVAAAKRWSKTDDWLAAGALVPPLVAAGFAAYFVSVPDAVAQPGWFFTTVFVADLAFLAVAWLHRPFAAVHFLAGPIALFLTALWSGALRSTELLPWAFGVTLVLAALHAVFPHLLARRDTDAATGAQPFSAGGTLFPLLALLVLFVPVLVHDDSGLWLWPAALALNLLALGAAALARSLAALAGAVLLTFVLLGAAILRLPSSEVAGAGPELWIVAGFALLFTAASVWLVRIWLVRPDVRRAAEPAWLDHLPSLSAALPFALVTMLVLKFRLPEPGEVFGVAALLAALLLGLAVIARQGALAVVALLGVLLVQFTWRTAHHPDLDLGAGLGWHIAFALAFTAFPFVFRRRALDLQGPCAAAALALPLHFVLIYSAINRLWPDHGIGGLVALGAAVPLLVALLLTIRLVPADAPHRLNRLAWFGGAALFFITLIFPLQFSNQWLTVSWAFEGVALLWLYHRVPHPGLRLVGFGLLLAVFARLTLNAEIFHYAERSPTPIFNWILYTYGLAAAACFVGAKLLAPPRDRVLGVRAPAVLQVLGTLLGFALINLEIADFFTPAGSTVELRIAGNFARDMTYPIAWTGCFLALLWLGLRQKMAWLRVVASVFLGLVFLRLLLNFDLFSYRGAGIAAWMLATYGVAAAGFFLAAHWLGAEGDAAFDRIATVGFRVLGTLLVFVLLNLQVAAHYTGVGDRLRFDFGHDSARDMTYTVAWAVYAIVMLVVGIRKKVAAARWGAFALLALTILKLFFHDLSRLETIYKVGAFMGVAVLGFAAAFLAQRFLGTEKKDQP